MDGVIVVIGSEGPGGKEWHGLVEEASVGRRVGHVGTEIDGGSVDLWVGGHVGDGGEEVVHHAGVVSVIDDRLVEPVVDVIKLFSGFIDTLKNKLDCLSLA